MAVLSDDQFETHRLLQKHPKCLEERESRFGLTPFHLAVGNPECLRILVEKSNSRLLVRSDKSRYTILSYAILLSKTLCDRREDRDETSCRCTLPLRILLEGGCPVIPHLDFRPNLEPRVISTSVESVIAYASLHCKIHLAKSLLHRRQELKSIAQQYLSSSEIDKFGLHRPVVLDVYATQVDEILRHRGIIEFGPLSTYMYNQSPDQDCWSIYHDLSNLEDANIYFDLGFHDISVPSDKPKTWRLGSHHHLSLPFLKWLLDRDAPICEWMTHWSLPRTGFIADAFILSILGREGPRNICARDGDEELVRELEERMLLDNSVDSCHCRCSPGGCTPFVVRMKYMGLEDSELDIATTITAYFQEHGSALRKEHWFAAIRFITFQALDIAHICHCGRENMWGSKLDTEDIAEIHDEYAEVLEVLESLTEEFEAHVCEIFDAATDGLDSLTTFWSGYWARRMSHVLSELSEVGEASKSAAEHLGVIWGPEPEKEICVEPSWESEGWGHYFTKIEEIE